jgi:hypothetical protein
MSSQVPQAPAGWFPDPLGRFESRYWDGRAWTSAVQRDGKVDSDPEAIPPDAAGSDHSKVEIPPGEAAAPPSSASDRETSLSPEDAQGRLAQMMAMSGITIRSSAPGRIDGYLAVKGQPNVVVAIILLFVCLIPGILYLVFASRMVSHPVSVILVASGHGTRIAARGSAQVLQVISPLLGQLPW